MPSGVGRDKAKQQAIVVRVIEYALPGLPDSQPRYRLMTTLLDPSQAPALELAALYRERWQVEAVFDELKTHLLKGLCADIDGFSLHAAVRCGADDRQALEQLCRYITRPALANERVQNNAAGQVVLKLKTPGATAPPTW